MPDQTRLPGAEPRRVVNGHQRAAVGYQVLCEPQLQVPGPCRSSSDAGHRSRQTAKRTTEGVHNAEAWGQVEEVMPGRQSR